MRRNGLPTIRVAREQRYPFPGSDLAQTSLAVTFILCAVLTLFVLKWLGREDE